MEKILITGSSGFIAKNLISYLSKNYLIKTLSLNSKDYKIDLSNEVPNIIEKFDIIIIVAGIAHKNVKNKYNLNINIIQNFLNGFSLDKLPKKIVLISSVSVYGLSKGDKIDENYPLRAFDSYGKSKIVIETITDNWCKINNVQCTILRLPLVVGSDTPGNFKLLLRNIKSGFILLINNGSNRKSILHIDDLCRFIIKSSYYPGIYNLTDGINPSISQLTKKLNNDYNKKNIYNIPFFLPLIFSYIGSIFFLPINYNFFLKYTSTLTFDDSKARNTFNWKPESVLTKYLS
jgi:nucleoside-diphosphate-sugar epimerase